MRKILAVVLLFALALTASADDDFCAVDGGNVCLANPAGFVGEGQHHGNTSSYGNTTCVIYFYGEGCPKCGKIRPFIMGLEKKYADRIHVHWLEVYHNQSNYGLYDEYTTRVGIPLKNRGIPFVIVGDTYLMGLDRIENDFERLILEEDDVSLCAFKGRLGCHQYNPLEVNPAVKRRVTIPLVVGAGLIDGINPCAFAVLIFLLAFLVEVSGSRKRMIKAAIAYIIAVYVTYFLAGLGILSVIKLTTYANTIAKVAAVIAIVAGLVNIKDYFWYGRGFSLHIPKSQKNNIEALIKKANIPAAIALGFLVSMVELPCTGGVYLAILALLAETATKTTAAAYLLLYNLMFVLPLIIITILVVSGMKAGHLERLRSGKKATMKLLLGLFMVALGVWILL